MWVELTTAPDYIMLRRYSNRLPPDHAVYSVKSKVELLTNPYLQITLYLMLGCILREVKGGITPNPLPPDDAVYDVSIL